MVEILGAPVIISCSYNPSYKVDVYLHDQLWGRSMTSNDLAIDVMTLLSELEMMCDKESQQLNNSSKYLTKGSKKRTYMATFDSQAALLQDKLEKLIKKHEQPIPNLQEYLSQSGLGMLYPRSAHYLSGLHGKSQPAKKAPMDGYLSHLAILNQVNALCKQLHHDVHKLNNHKYIAHQVALLYQSLNQLGNVKALLTYRNNIEGMFKKLKAALELTAAEGDTVPHLPDEYKQWLSDLTVSLQEVMSSFNPSFNQPLLPAIGFLQQNH